MFVQVVWLMCLYEHASMLTHLSVAIVCWFMVDLLIGILHMTMDNPHWKDHWLLKYPSFVFHEHHQQPHKIYTCELIDQITEPLPITLLLTAYCMWLGSHMFPFLFWNLIFVFFNSYVHRVCHMPKQYRPHFMQHFASLGIITTPEFHAQHHQTLNSHFTILNSCTAPLFNYLEHYKWSVYWPYVFISLFITYPVAASKIFIFHNM